MRAYAVGRKMGGVWAGEARPNTSTFKFICVIFKNVRRQGEGGTLASDEG